MSLNYTTGDPTNLTGGGEADMTDLSGPFTDIKTFLTDGAASIGTTLLANNAVTAAKIEAQQAWQTLAISASNFPGGNLMYFKDSLGMVHFRGDAFTATTGVVAGAATLGTLPAGYRPVTTQVFTVVEATGSVSQRPVQITAAGVISVPAGLAASSSYSFGAVHFRAEN